MHELSELIQKIVVGWVGGLEDLGYWGIFLLMTVESSFIPFPSEIVMIPAGYSAAQGDLNLWGCIAAGIGGSIAGALINYFLAVSLGRTLLLKFGKYFFVPQDKMLMVEGYFAKHGQMTTFVCRLIPAVRQLISIPAGLARMNLARFCFFTGLGAGLWVIILTLTGYYFGDAAIELWKGHKTLITAGILVAVVLMIGFYVIRHRMRVARAAASQNPA
ncbi:Inner membrane protein YqjA [Symmachiella macrocystis]|uniref:Inner membrane protein YqjA n=1 Tax=Symmachiella macrocystis TaxID=2527985 RepID=A0A5C6B783_9PLAN|nr:DedA family protein [Symmachiella macrocystis]TWU07156.1 Inner membrane protein YqjA [Symmachiella macrocystis]